MPCSTGASGHGPSTTGNVPAAPSPPPTSTCEIVPAALHAQSVPVIGSQSMPVTVGGGNGGTPTPSGPPQPGGGGNTAAMSAPSESHSSPAAVSKPRLVSGPRNGTTKLFTTTPAGVYAVTIRPSVA